MCSTHGGSAPWSSIVAALESAVGVDVTAWSDAQVRAGLPALLRAYHQLTALVSAVVASFDARDLADADGFKTARSWLIAYGRMSQGAATGWLRRGRLLRDLPELGAVARAGGASAEQLRLVDELCRKVGTDRVRECDTTLATLAPEATPAQVGAVCERIRAWIDPDGPEPDPTAHQRRELTLSRQGSLVQIRGQLDLEGAAVVHTALDAWLSPPAPDDPRTAAHRRADALVEALRHALRQGQTPTVGGTRPQLGLLLTPEALANLRPATPAGPAPSTRPGAVGDAAAHSSAGPAGSPAGPAVAGAAVRTKTALRTGAPPAAAPPATAPPLGAPPAAAPPLGAPRAGGGGPDLLAALAAGPEPPWLNGVGPIPTTTAQRLACDSDTFRLVLDPTTGLPLDLGRTHRLVPTWIRKALHARDRGCRWPGCTAPTSWTDAHHLLAWYHDGETNIDNLILTCRHHHMRLHEDGWTAHLDPTTGLLWITRPDGTPYELGPSHPWRPTPDTESGSSNPHAETGTGTDTG